MPFGFCCSRFYLKPVFYDGGKVPVQLANHPLNLPHVQRNLGVLQTRRRNKPRAVEHFLIVTLLDFATLHGCTCQDQERVRTGTDLQGLPEGRRGHLLLPFCIHGLEEVFDGLTVIIQEFL